MDLKPSMEISEYNRDQLEAIQMVRRRLGTLSRAQIEKLRRRIRPYLRFRKDVADFQEQYFSDVCTEKCFTSQTSACCGREGIATFFADVVMNVLLSREEEVEGLLQTLSQDTGGFKCIYLGENGCLWRLKPIVCEMFLCEHAKDAVLGGDAALRDQWEKLRQREKRYTWPSRPVLFDELEEIFIGTGCDSPLMYFHRSPGLLRIKAKDLKNRPKKPA
ncbi:MAG: hypothetical protein PVH02_00405 [Desulfobacteraceae bacterium]|jgi:hypothetical protein